MANSKKNDINSILSEAIENIREDRDLTYDLLNELKSDLSTNKVTQKEVGFTAAKYMETLQRSNEQLVKLIAIMKEKNPKSNEIEISEDEVEELFETIKE